MSQLSKHFRRSEFACKCGCGYNTVDAALISALEALREVWDKPITITSAARCKAHNKAVGGSASSQHLLGKAADIQVRGVPASEVQAALAHHVGGVGAYDTFTHIDVRSGKVRWNG